MSQPPDAHEPREQLSDVPVWGRIFLSAVFVLLASLIIYALIVLWPDNGKAAPFNKAVFAGWQWNLSADQYVVVLVVLGGALGGAVSSLLKMQKYIGEGRLKWRWALSYIVQPFSGAALSMILYVVIRAGFVSFKNEAGAIDVYGFLALALLSGLFANNVIEKLREVAESVFSKESGDNESGTPGGDDVKKPTAPPPGTGSTPIPPPPSGGTPAAAPALGVAAMAANPLPAPPAAGGALK